MTADPETVLVQTAERLAEDLIAVRSAVGQYRRIAKSLLLVLSVTVLVLWLSSEFYFDGSFVGRQKFLYFCLILPGANLCLSILLFVLGMRLDKIKDLLEDAQPNGYVP